MAADITIDALGEFKPSKDAFAALLAAGDVLTERLLAPPVMALAEAAPEGISGFENFVGIGIGVKQRDNRETNELAIKVYVQEKLSEDAIFPAALVPPEFEGVPTDVEAIGEVFAQSFKNRVRPVPGGVSAGNCTANMAGTLGCFVLIGDDGFALSNNHVFALSNSSPANAQIPQPGRLDLGNCEKDVIGGLHHFVPLDFTGGPNSVDAAIARVDDNNLIDRGIIRPQRRREALQSPHMAPAIGMDVQKSGRTTGHTRGRIDAVRISVKVSYRSHGVATFTNQFRVRGNASLFSDSGDSGSLVTTDPRNQPVGLLFAGGQGVTFCNNIDTVLTDLGVSIAY